MAFKSYREGSRIDWGTVKDGNLNNEQVQLGAILRIADATEKMAKNYLQMETDLRYYKRRYEEEKGAAARLARSNAALRGCIKRLKKSS